jgi:MOSC domain-containing protein YiiM
MKLRQINVNPRGGVPKMRVPQARLHAEGVEGDKQRDRRFHGGPLRAVSLYSWDLIGALRAEGHPIDAGTTGENLTLEGVNWNEMKPGVRLGIGEAELEITSYVVPCKKIAASFREDEWRRIGQKTHPGWSRVYARVLREATVNEGDEVTWSTVAFDRTDENRMA